jgi:heat shock protein HtpX
MASLYTHQSQNVRRTWVLFTVFLIVVIAIGWAISWYYDDPVILVVAAAFAIFQSIISYWFSDKIVLSMSGAKQINRESDPELWNIVENLSITAGLPMPRVYIINDPAPNAFATGRNPKHAALAFTTGLLQRLDQTELEGVAAHELAHVGNRDILVMTVAVVLVGFVTLVADIFIRRTLWFGGSNRDNNNRNGALMIIALVFIILSPLFAQLVQLAISRKREFLADASGALLTRYPEGLASALEKISQYPGELKRANRATAHLYISDPFKNKKRRGMRHLFATHPPVQDRIAKLRD